MSKDLEFQSSLTDEEVRQNFAEIDFFERFIAGLQEAAACEQGETDSQAIVHTGATVETDGFDDLILAELTAEGLSGDALKAAFEERKTQIRSAVESMIADASAAAKGEGECYTMEDVFGEDTE